MNMLQLISSQPWMENAGWTLLHFVWQGALIAGVLLVGRSRLRTPQARYLLACTALAAMMAAPIATFAWLGAGQSAPSFNRAAVLSNASVSTTSAGLWQADLWAQVLPWMVMLWLAGVLALLVRLTGGWLMTARIRATGRRPADGDWQQTLEHLIARLGVTRPVALLTSSGVEAPVVIGWLRPVILMPLGALTGLPREHVEALLAHELAHIRRHDFLINVLQGIAEAVLFYHPAVWWASAQIRAERELCCDDIAVAASGDALTYARALTNFEACRPAHVNTALGADGRSLRDRIRRLLHPAETASDIRPGAGAACALAVLIALGVCAVVTLPAAPPQVPVVDRATIWADTVKSGDMEREVRGLGVLTSATAADLKIAERHAKELKLGQAVAIGYRNSKAVTTGKVARIQPAVANLVPVNVQVTGTIPDGVHPPVDVDATIHIELLKAVVYVGRPVFGNADSTVTLFRVEPDGNSAVRVNVQLGRASVNQIEIRSGLKPGDKVILSDMTKYQAADRVNLR